MPALFVAKGEEDDLGFFGGQGQEPSVGQFGRSKEVGRLRELFVGKLQHLPVSEAKRGTAMTKADLVEQVAGVTGLTKRDVGVVVDLLLETISKALCEKEHIEIRGFGSFKVKTKKARIARNPRTGAQVEVPQKTVPYFKASRELVKLIDSA